MKLSEFTAQYTEEFRCEVSYFDTHNNKITGVVLDHPIRQRGKASQILVDSFSQKIALSRIIDLKVTNIKW